MKNKTLALLSLLPLTLAIASCRSRGELPAEASPFTAGDTVYARVGMHFDAKNGKYLTASTNYIAVNKHVAPGAKFTYESAQRRRRGAVVTLTGDDGATYEIEFVPKHSLMPIGEWLERQFATGPVELPGDLTEAERSAIGQGAIENGMSRNAVFLSVGYPPKSTNPSLQDTNLVYQRNRFARRTVVFDENDRVVAQ